MTITRRSFRLFLLAHVLTMVLALAASFGLFGETFSVALNIAYENEIGAIANQPALLFEAEMMALTALSVANIVGLYRFRHWGRVLGLWMCLLAVPLTISFGPLLETGIEAALMDLSTLLWGGLIALAFCSPVSAEFTTGRRAASKAHP